MAQKVQVLLTCDMEQGEKPANETVAFAVDGSSYEIDLCEKHAKQFRDSVNSYVSAARRAAVGGGTRRRAGGGANRRDRERTQAIREWARKKGIKVSERGRLSAHVVAQYEASGGR
ncbi:MAG TPA: Lsr2 family protein [Frankiaceae bacterium]|nr:Lsr2 family protein [Frankiaceae bacterium]